MITGLLFHCHHSKHIAEWTDNAKERFKVIEYDKPLEEVALRFAVMTLVRMEDLPRSMQEAYAKRQEAYAKRQEAYAKWREADDKWQEAGDTWAEANHSKYCHPHCPWDGKTIFAKGKSADVLWETA